MKKILISILLLVILLELGLIGTIVYLKVAPKLYTKEESIINTNQDNTSKFAPETSTASASSSGQIEGWKTYKVLWFRFDYPQFLYKYDDFGEMNYYAISFSNYSNDDKCQQHKDCYNVKLSIYSPPYQAQSDFDPGGEYKFVNTLPVRSSKIYTDETGIKVISREEDF